MVRHLLATIGVWLAVLSSLLVLDGVIGSATAEGEAIVGQAATDFTWAGSSSSAAWSTAANWVSSSGPSASTSVDALEFPALTSAACTASPPAATCGHGSNDLANLRVRALSIDGRGYALGGQGITLGSGGLTLTQPAPATPGTTTLDLPLTLDADQAWSVSGVSGAAPNQTNLVLDQPVTGAGDALTINLANGADLALGSAGNEVGSVTVIGANPGALTPDFNGTVVLGSDLNGTDAQPVSVTHASLQGSGTVGPVTITGGSLRVGESGPPRVLHAPSAALDASSLSGFFLYGTGGSAGFDYGQLQSTGTISLGGAVQIVSFLPSCAPLPRGQVLTLVTTTGALQGQFGGVPDGAQVSITPSGGCKPGAQKLVIHYLASGTTQTVTGTVASSDTTAPAITVSTPAAGQQFVQGASAASAFTCDDGSGSGVASCTGPAVLDTATAGAKTFVVTAEDFAGNSASKAVNYDVVPDETPTAKLTAKQSAGTQTIEFTGSGSDPDGSISSYSWNFGDGSPAGTGPKPGHAYATPGTYTVTLTVIDSAGLRRVVAYHIAVADETPAAAYTFTNLAGHGVKFTGSGSDPDGSISSYSWNFGDGSPAGTGATPTHAYATAGSMTVTLTVTDSAGVHGAVGHRVTVT